MKRYRLAVCKGPDCTRGGSDAVFAKARELAPSSCEVYRGGCYGLCHLGPNVVLREDPGGKRDPFSREDFQLLRTVVLPSSVPFIFTGARLGLGRGLVGVVVGELYAATAGVGYLITVAGATFQTDKVFVGVLIITIAGVGLNAILLRIEERFSTWRPRIGEETGTT